jgi:hypothetical protein
MPATGSDKHNEATPDFPSPRKALAKALRKTPIRSPALPYSIRLGQFFETVCKMLRPVTTPSGGERPHLGIRDNRV